jgi:predicted XRE-type DNA-binding protein
MSTESKKTKNAIDLKTKQKILNEVDRNEFSKTKIAAKFGIPKSTLSTIIKNRKTIDEVVASGAITGHRKRLRTAKYEDVEEELLQWFNHTRSSNIPLSGPIVQEKAKEIARTYGIEVDEFSSSSGWLWRFQKRHNIVSHVMCGEACSRSKCHYSFWPG